MTLIENIHAAIQDDDGDDSERLAALYSKASQTGKKLLDDAMICICGYSVKSLQEMADD